MGLDSSKGSSCSSIFSSFFQPFSAFFSPFPAFFHPSPDKSLPKEGGVSLKRSQLGIGAFLTWGIGDDLSFYIYSIFSISIWDHRCVIMFCFAEVTRQGIRHGGSGKNPQLIRRRIFRCLLFTQGHVTECFCIFTSCSPFLHLFH